MHKRIKIIRKALKINQLDFAQQIGLSQTSLSTMECGRAPIIEKNIKLICKTFNVNELWFRTGNGEMFCASPHEKEFQDIFKQLTPDIQDYLLSLARGLLKLQGKMLTPTGDAGSQPADKAGQ
jgi:transcriptional regulator with XRE-family HTH domain